jgi:hypothetical protein
LLNQREYAAETTEADPTDAEECQEQTWFHHSSPLRKLLPVSENYPTIENTS